MTRSLNPTLVHPAECTSCLAWIRDSETLSYDGDCQACVAEREEDDADREGVS